MSYGTVQAEKVTTESGYSLGAGNASSFKNRVINGAMAIDQRNAGASVNASDGTFSVDRWQAYVNSGLSNKFTMQQNAGSVTPPVGYSYYLGCTTVSTVSLGSGDAFNVAQKIEGFNFADLAWGTASAKSITLSFWVYSSLTGTFGGALSNSALNRSYPFSYTISSANTWTQINVTVAGDTTGTWLTTNGTGCRVIFSLGSGTTYSGTANTWAAADYRSTTGAVNVIGTLSATWYVTGVQLEVGTVATSFDFRSIGTELALCQRYFQYLLLFAGNSGGPLSIVRASSVSGASESNVMFSGPVMRANPTATAITGTSNILYASSFGGAGSSFSYSLNTTTNSLLTGQVMRFRGGPSLTDGTAYVLWNNGGDLISKLDAEL